MSSTGCKSNGSNLMGMIHDLEVETRSEAPESDLAEIGGKPYGQLSESEGWKLHDAKPGDLRLILDSAMQKIPPNIELVVAISAICGRAIFAPKEEETQAALTVGFHRVGGTADQFLARQQR